MQKCEYCGRESRDALVTCGECGMRFLPEAAPPVSLRKYCALAKDVVAKPVKRYGHMFRRTVCLLASACWFCIALGFGVVLVQYLFSGAGVQFFGFVISSASVLLGVVHVTGFTLAMVFSFVLAIWLAACGMTPRAELENKE